MSNDPAIKLTPFTLDTSTTLRQTKTPCLFFAHSTVWNKPFSEIHAKQWPSPTLIFTHGKGSKLENVVLRGFCTGFAGVGDDKSVLAFEGNDDLDRRVALWRTVLTQWPGIDLFAGKEVGFGGRSMGARAGVRAAAWTNVKKFIAFAYPLYSGDEGDGLGIRDEELLALHEDCEILFMIGTKDEMGAYPILDKVRKSMRAKSWLIKITGMDHSFRNKSLKDASEESRIETAKELGRIAGKWWDERDVNLTESRLWWDKDSDGGKGKPVFGGWEKGDGGKTVMVTTYDVSGVNGGSWSVTKSLR